MTAHAARDRLAPESRALIVVRAAEVLALAGIAWIGGLLMWTLLAPATVVPAGPPAAQMTSSLPARPAVDRSILWRAQPFAPADMPAASGALAPETTLNLQLAGVAAGVGGTPGIAFILTPDNRQQAFREDDAILEGVTLAQVFADRVTIRRQGVLETLYLPGAAPVAGAPAPDRAPVGRAAPAFSATQLYDAIQFEAVMRDGRISGMRLDRALDRAVVSAAGLAEGDVLVEINGQALADMPDFIGTFEGLGGDEPVSIVVERSGARLPVTLSFGIPQ